jgi:hypothetical protein
MTITIFGHIGSDTGYTTLDKDTGVVTVVPGNRKDDDLRRALEILKTATEIKDPEFRKATVRAAADYFNGNTATEILGPSGNIIAIF